MAEMIMDGIIALNKAKKYTAESLDGLGALKGANCIIKSTTPKDNGTEIVFEWTGISGAKETTTILVKNGEQGNGVVKVEKIKTVDLVDTYRMTFDDGSTFDYEVANGDSSLGGKINIIRVNGVELPVIDKTVDIEIPEYIYIGNTEPTDENVVLWVNPDETGGGGTGGSEVFDRDDLTVVTVGGLNAGSSVKDKTTKEVLEEILFPYQKPTVSFTISPSTTTYAVGDTISSITFTINAGKKSKDIQSIKIYDGSTLLTTITSGVANGGTFTYNYACNITANTTLKVEVADDASTVFATKNITFTYKSYYGFVADGTTVDETAVKGLQKNVLKTSRALTYSGITCTNSKIVYAYPQSQGLLSSILDGNGFDYLGSYNYSVISVDGVNYYVYVMIDPTTLDDFMQKFA